MNFLFPLYLLGALAIALPVLLHLRKRPPKEKVSFGSLMFLEKSPEKLTRRTKIDKWLLLALRCLALLALALVFGRPFLKSATLPSELPDGSITVVLVDRSASMQREDLAKKALAAATDAIKTSNSADDVALLFFDRETHQVASFAEWSKLEGRSRSADLNKRVASMTNSWDISKPGKALVEAADLIAAKATDKEYRSREIVLISDFIEGADFDAINQFAWPEGLTVECVEIKPNKRGNISLTLAASSAESRTAAERTHRVRIANAADSESDRFELAWKDSPDSKITGIVPPGSSRVVKMPSSTNVSNTGELIVTGDAHPYDNTVYIAPPTPLPLSIRFLSDLDSVDEAGSPFFYLKRALHATSSLSPTVEAAKFGELTDVAEDASSIVVHGDWTDEVATAAFEEAEKGKLVIALVTPETKSSALSNLLGIPDLKITESISEKYAMLAALDFQHPVLAPFARAQIRDFTKVRFWKHRQLEFPGNETPADVSVLAEFDSGTPAWVVKTVGEGSVFVFLSSWEPKESQFALSSKFVPVLYSIFENAGYSAKSAPTYYVGQVDVINEGNSGPAIQPGLFTTQLSNGTEAQIGINLHPSEGRIDPVDPNHVLADFSIPLKVDKEAKAKQQLTEVKDQKRLEATEKEASQKLWKWLVIAVIVFLIAETWLSGRREKSISAPATA